MRLIIGLGNPGKKYEHTRHNAGFLATDAFVKEMKRLGVVERWRNRSKLLCMTAEGRLRDELIVCAKPTTFMNESGKAVQSLVHDYRAKATDILVIHDDKDLPLGTVKYTSGRGHAGHNGVRSIIEALGTKQFSRVRIGIATADQNIQETANFVLGQWTAEEEKKIEGVVNGVVAHLFL